VRGPDDAANEHAIHAEPKRPAGTARTPSAMALLRAGVVYGRFCLPSTRTWLRAESFPAGRRGSNVRTGQPLKLWIAFTGTRRFVTLQTTTWRNPQATPRGQAGNSARSIIDLRRLKTP